MQTFFIQQNAKGLSTGIKKKMWKMKFGLKTLNAANKGTIIVWDTFNTENVLEMKTGEMALLGSQEVPPPKGSLLPTYIHPKNKCPLGSFPWQPNVINSPPGKCRQDGRGNPQKFAFCDSFLAMNFKLLETLKNIWKNIENCWNIDPTMEIRWNCALKKKVE